MLLRQVDEARLGETVLPSLQDLLRGIDRWVGWRRPAEDSWPYHSFESLFCELVFGVWSGSGESEETEQTMGGCWAWVYVSRFLWLRRSARR